MSGAIVVHVETDGTAPTRTSMQSLDAAWTWASARSAPVVAVTEAAHVEVVRPYATQAYGVQVGSPGYDGWVDVLALVATDVAAHGVVVTANRFGQAVAPRVAVRLGAAYLEDASSLSVEGSALRIERPSQLQRVRETLETSAATVVVSVRPGSFAAPAPSSSLAEVTLLDAMPVVDGGRMQVTPQSTRRDGRKVSLDDASIVVTGGRGVGSQQGFADRVEPLAAALAAAVGSTRAVVDAGWRPYDEQIGQTGASVAPDVYVALGVSGAVQHLSGMRGSRQVIAIDVDPDAPIFRHCDVGVVADLHAFVPILLEALGDRST